jgi:hypothetical protein
LIDVRIGALRNFPFKPKVHLNYEETVLPMKDRLPKLRDFPASIGGRVKVFPNRARTRHFAAAPQNARRARSRELLVILLRFP